MEEGRGVFTNKLVELVSGPQPVSSKAIEGLPFGMFTVICLVTFIKIRYFNLQLVKSNEFSILT